MRVIARYLLAVGLLLFIAASLESSASAQGQRPYPRNELPLYGGIRPTPQQQAADDEFVRYIQSIGYTRESGSTESVKRGWLAFQQGDIATAVKRFNQGWILDPKNGDTYHGLAVVTYERGLRDRKQGFAFDEAQIDRLFQTAVTAPRKSTRAHVDYARYLLLNKRPAQAIPHLNQALTREPKVEMARLLLAAAYADLGQKSEACKWARQAQAVRDPIDPKLVAEVC